MFETDEFRMYEFKVRRCANNRPHDWTVCPFAHPGEKALRRDPRKYYYSGNPCPEFRKGGECKKGNACEYAHGVFECWLHPARYRSQLCKASSRCRRRVCFFAHSHEQLRVTVPAESLKQLSYDSCEGSTLVSPPYSPLSGSNSIDEMDFMLSNMRLPADFNSNRIRSGIQVEDLWSRGCLVEEPVMERVESGRNLRAAIFEKLSKRNSFGRGHSPGYVQAYSTELVG